MSMDTLYRKVNLETVFGGTGSAVADIASGSLIYMVAPAIAGTTATLSFSCRVRFTDSDSINYRFLKCSIFSTKDSLRTA